MGYKNNDRCLDRVSDQEPIFVLRAADKFAPALVRLWADLAEEHGCTRVQEARAQADLMEAWPNRKFPD